MSDEHREQSNIVIHFNPPPSPILTRRDLCDTGHHRWAWLVDGRQACGYCGRYR